MPAGTIEVGKTPEKRKEKKKQSFQENNIPQTIHIQKINI